MSVMSTETQTVKPSRLI